MLRRGPSRLQWAVGGQRGHGEWGLALGRGGEWARLPSGAEPRDGGGRDKDVHLPILRKAGTEVTKRVVSQGCSQDSGVPRMQILRRVTSPSAPSTAQSCVKYL